MLHEFFVIDSNVRALKILAVSEVILVDILRVLDLGRLMMNEAKITSTMTAAVCKVNE